MDANDHYKLDGNGGNSDGKFKLVVKKYTHKKPKIHSHSFHVSLGFYANISDNISKAIPWAECHITEAVCENSFKVCYSDVFGQTHARIVASYDLAEARSLGRNTPISRGIRVISQRDPQKLLKYHESRSDEDVCLTRDDGFYAGFTGEQRTIDDTLHSMVFFDDGHVQYVPTERIRSTMCNDKCAHANENIQHFYDYYMALLDSGDMIKSFQIQVPAVDDLIKIDSHCYWEKAKVLIVEGELIKVFFMESDRTEWLWVGSPRINRVWSALMWHDKVNKQTASVEDDYNLIDLVDTDDNASKPKLSNDPSADDLKSYIETLPAIPNVKHFCTDECVPYERSLSLSKYQALVRPMLSGWKRRARRQKVFYIAPCGLVFDRHKTISKFLLNTNSSLSFECFTFNINVDCFKDLDSGEKVLIEDISNGKEAMAVRMVGHDITAYPDDFEYITSYHIDNSSIPPYRWQPYRQVCCDCEDDCSDRSKCACQQLTNKKYVAENPSEHSDGMVGYDNGHLYDTVLSGIFECHSGCTCRKTCMNRVISKDLRYKFEVFQTKECGWGVRTRQDLPAGVYVSQYMGDLLPDKHLPLRAEVSGDSYFFLLDAETTTEANEPLKKKSRKSTPTEQLHSPETSIPYFPSTNQLHNPNDKKPYTIDGRYRGNFTRFINHSCDPNLLVQTAYIDTHDKRFPWVGFFTSRFIKAGEEIAFHYGYKDLGRGIPCKCGAKNCSGIFV